jgi:hypothetical protein
MLAWPVLHLWSAKLEDFSEESEDYRKIRTPGISAWNEWRGPDQL